MKKYGHIIASLRKKAGLTQDQLGQKLNVTYQAVSKWENNLSEPDLETIDKITQIFGITVAQFFDMEQNPNLNIKEQKNIPKQQVTGLDFISKKPWWLIAGLGILIFILSLCVFFIPKQQSSDNIFKNISPSTFSINTYKEYDHLYRSTGFFINNSGLAVTTFDIIDGATRGNINLDGKTYSIESVVGVDKEQDIALIQIDITHSKPVVIGSAGTELAQKVYTVGYNQNCQAILNESLISKISHENNHKYWQLLTTSCQDGSALVNQYGQVVGILTDGFYGDAGMDTAVPLTEINNIQKNINLSLQEYYDNKKNFNFYSNGSVIAKQEFLSGHKVKPIDNPIRTGYSFAGWYTNETFETKFDFDSQVTTQNACYAKWTPNTYSIKFNANGG
ncbi:MAG: helix-turn-helix domain-containing protein, partial [Clostridia bacterium]|nr:helix-turn-helix domain-containing protein [Clostridia bacterium]